MAEDNEVRVIHRPNTLKVKCGGDPDGEPGQVDQGDLRRAENAVRRMAEAYPYQVDDQLVSLQKSYEEAVANEGLSRYNAVVDIRDIAHEIRGAAGTFGYSGVTKIANSLYDFTTNPDNFTPEHLEVVKIHIDAIRAMLHHGGPGEGGPEVTEITTSLKLAISRLRRRGGR